MFGINIFLNIYIDFYSHMNESRHTDAQFHDDEMLCVVVVSGIIGVPVYRDTN